MLSDATLVERAQAGDRDAFSEIVCRYQDQVFRIVKRTTQVDGHGAEDLAQETFLRAFRSLGSFRGDCPFHLWLFRIATNVTINKATSTATREERKALSLDAPVRTRKGDLAMDPADPATERPDGALERGDLRKALEDALGRLHETFRTAVVLRDVEGLDYEAIAEILEVPIGTVRSRIHRGREELREILQRTWGTPALEAG